MSVILQQLKEKGIKPVPAISIPRVNSNNEFIQYLDNRSLMAPDVFRSDSKVILPLYNGADYEQARCDISIEKDIKRHLKRDYHNQIKNSQSINHAKYLLNKLETELRKIEGGCGIWWTENPENIKNSEYMVHTAEKLAGVFIPYLLSELRGVPLKATFGEHKGKVVPVKYSLN